MNCTGLSLNLWSSRPESPEGGARRLIGIVCAALFHGLVLSLFLFAQESGFYTTSGDGKTGSNSEITVSLLDGHAAAARAKTPAPQPRIPITSQSSALTTSVAPASPISVAAGKSGDADSISQDAAMGSNGTVSSEFQRKLQAHIAAYRQYPAEARRQRLEGVVELIFTMDRNGVVLGVWVKKSSGYAVFDREAIATVLRAQPLPAIPKELPDPINITFPVAFGMPS